MLFRSSSKSLTSRSTDEAQFRAIEVYDKLRRDMKRKIPHGNLSTAFMAQRYPDQLLVNISLISVPVYCDHPQNAGHTRMYIT